MSVADVARKFKCSQALIGKLLKSREYKTYHEKKTPKRSIDGEIKAIRLSKKLYKHLSRANLCIIEDDETYYKNGFSQLPAQQYFYQSKGRYVANKLKYV